MSYSAIINTTAAHLSAAVGYSVKDFDPTNPVDVFGSLPGGVLSWVGEGWPWEQAADQLFDIESVFLQLELYRPVPVGGDASLGRDSQRSIESDLEKAKAAIRATRTLWQTCRSATIVETGISPLEISVQDLGIKARFGWVRIKIDIENG